MAYTCKWCGCSYTSSYSSGYCSKKCYEEQKQSENVQKEQIRTERANQDALNEQKKYFEYQKRVLQEEQLQKERARRRKEEAERFKRNVSLLREKIQEYQKYAIERNLSMVFFNSQGVFGKGIDSSIFPMIEDIFDNSELFVKLSHEERLINLNDFGLQLPSSFTLKELKIYESQDFNQKMDYFTIVGKQSDVLKSWYINSKEVIQEKLSSSGYDGKEINITGYDYILFLKEDEMLKFLDDLEDLVQNNLKILLEQFKINLKFIKFRLPFKILFWIIAPIISLLTWAMNNNFFYGLMVFEVLYIIFTTIIMLSKGNESTTTCKAGGLSNPKRDFVT